MNVDDQHISYIYSADKWYTILTEDQKEIYRQMGMNFDSTQWIEMDSFNKETFSDSLNQFPDYSLYLKTPQLNGDITSINGVPAYKYDSNESNKLSIWISQETGDLMKITIEDLIYEFSDINKQTEIKLPTNAKTYDQISEEASKQFESSYSTDYNFSDSYQSPKSSIRMSP